MYFHSMSNEGENSKELKGLKYYGSAGAGFLILFGLLIAISGWIWLINGPSLGGANIYGGKVINLHSLSIAQNVIYLGYALIVFGLLSKGQYVSASLSELKKSFNNESAYEAHHKKNVPAYNTSIEEQDLEKIQQFKILNRIP